MHTIYSLGHKNSSQPKTVWDFTLKTSAVKQWAEDLASIANSNFKTNDLALAGRGVLLEHYDVEAIEGYAQSVAKQAGLHFLAIRNENILDIDGWYNSLAKFKPTLVYLEPGVWMSKGLAGDEDNEWPHIPDFSDEKAAIFRKKLASKLFSNSRSYKYVAVAGIQSHHQIDFSLRKVGLFDRRIVLSDLDFEAKAKLFVKRIGVDILDCSITLNLRRLGCLIHHEFPRLRQRELFIQAVKRLAWRMKRKVGFQDLVIFAVYGTSESDVELDPPSIRYRHAIHEAGHALLIHLDSREKLPPEYSSVRKRGDSLGIVVRGFEDHEKISTDLSFRDIVHKIRVLIAGRAAEFLLLGGDEISAFGASSDLEKATNLAGKLFGKQGHSPDISTDIAAGSNLATCVGKPSASEYEHVESLYRPFLNQQFQHVIKIMRENLGYLEAIAEELNEKTILLRDDFLTIHKKFQ